MNPRSLLFATAGLALALAVSGCPSKKSDGGGGGGLDPVIRGDGSAADFACNHTFADPVSTGATVGMKIRTAQQELSGNTTDLPGTVVVDFDVATASTSGVGVVSSSSAIALMSETDSTRVGFVGHHAAVGSVTYSDTYGVNFLSPAVGSTSGEFVLRVIPTTIASAFVSLLNVTDAAGKFSVAGTVGDCTRDDAQIKNAQIEVPGGHRCSESTATPCFAYIHNNIPDVGATATDETGTFVLVGLTPNTPVTIKINGILTAGGTIEQIGELKVNGGPDAIVLGASNPLRQ